MENDIVDKNEIIEDLNKCQYCGMLLSSKLFEDHILCHKINEEENINNNNNILNNPLINKKNEKKNSETEGNTDGNTFKNKFFGFFENIGNKAKDIFNKGKEEEKNNTQNTIEEEQPSKISIMFNNLTDKISQKFDEIKFEIKKKFDKEDSDLIQEDNDRTDNIDDLLIRFEEEDNRIIDKKENLFKEEDANEILRYIPNSIITEEKNKNDNNYKCVICLNEFKIGDKVCTIPCLHIFHIDCLKKWIIMNRWCPICKFDFSLDSLLRDNIADNI